ncbi:glycerate kinase family protein [Streptococcus loxodontisalivarius]|uniref:Glycerate kinase n=1 Tax=Streptococcus loxodontisalivarius TaxID=1349415 RepID=A0ABS2PQ93_9STRE|nr:glycerate kinase [Streptococcus loxodontisalivarius]MBM7642209.1 glycerate kinase [Streptococcus loxodontisalivarius]
MHILIAPDSFKESLSAQKVAEALQAGFAAKLPQATFDLAPIGDGGEGTLSALAQNLDLTYSSLQLPHAFSENGRAIFASKDKLAVFEMAEVCGLEKVALGKRDPLHLSTQGVGEMILALYELGMREIILGVGGSSTNDGGIGMARGLGYRFLDENGSELEAIGANLAKIKSIDKSQVKSMSDLSLTIVTDVSNKLCGKYGATYIFAGQKGLDASQFEQVDKDMETFYQTFNPSILDLAGAGAGGGMAAGLVTFASGQIVSGIDFILDRIDFDRRVAQADLVIVGEGRMDAQSLSGKAPVGIARRTPKEKPVLAICGSLSDDLPSFPAAGISAAFPIISKVQPLEETLAEAEVNLRRTAENIANLLLLNP